MNIGYNTQPALSNSNVVFYCSALFFPLGIITTPVYSVISLHNLRKREQYASKLKNPAAKEVMNKIDDFVKERNGSIFSLPCTIVKNFSKNDLKYLEYEIKRIEYDFNLKVSSNTALITTLTLVLPVAGILLAYKLTKNFQTSESSAESESDRKTLKYMKQFDERWKVINDILNDAKLYPSLLKKDSVETQIQNAIPNSSKNSKVEVTLKNTDPYELSGNSSKSLNIKKFSQDYKSLEVDLSHIQEADFSGNKSKRSSLRLDSNSSTDKTSKNLKIEAEATKNQSVDSSGTLSKSSKYAFDLKKVRSSETKKSSKRLSIELNSKSIHFADSTAKSSKSLKIEVDTQNSNVNDNTKNSAKSLKVTFASDSDQPKKFQAQYSTNGDYAFKA
jgi:hypothetical protein